MITDIIDEKNLLPDGAAEIIETCARAAMEIEGVEDACVCVSVVDGEEIRALNARTRDVDRETDVLSFPVIRYPAGKTAKDVPQKVKRAYDPQYGKSFLGDVVLNIARAREQAEEYGHSLARETGYLTAHACFHLMGYDHMTDEDKALMREKEKAAMKKVGLYRNGAYGMNEEEYKKLAVEALDKSYSPYSRFRVGACLVCEDGETFIGANFENASFGATICAERCAVSNAIAHGKRWFTAIYISSDESFAWPCGICRQVLNEFKCGDMEVHAGSVKTGWKMKKLSELLPESFGPEDLPGEDK